jgi:hypothetical protein
MLTIYRMNFCEKEEKEMTSLEALNIIIGLQKDQLKLLETSGNARQEAIEARKNVISLIEEKLKDSNKKEI